MRRIRNQRVPAGESNGPEKIRGKDGGRSLILGGNHDSFQVFPQKKIEIGGVRIISGQIKPQGLGVPVGSL